MLLAAGLWAERAHRPTSRTRAVLVAAIGIGGLIATGAGLRTVARALAFGGAHLANSVATATLTTASFVALVALALAAARAAPHRGWVPEMLIAAGASVTLAATAWAWSFPYFTPGLHEVPEERFLWVFTLPYVAAVVGALALFAGFGLAGLALLRARAADAPAA